MDDFNVSTLNQSKNEWASRLVNILTPFMIEGLRSIFDDSLKLCKDNNELNKYLMTFQNFISRIPKWNPTMIETEKNRIVEKSKCTYLEDLITCVYIIQLKLLTAVRVGQKQKKIDINIPKVDDFIHKVYVNIARKIYKYVYLFEINIAPLQIQRNNRDLELIVQECILNTVRESIPIEAILRAYMDETTEDVYIEEIKEEIIPPTKEEIQEEKIQEQQIKLQELQEEVKKASIQFNNTDYAQDENKIVHEVNAPKTFERLEEISSARYLQRKAEEEDDDDDDDNIKLKIFDDNVFLNNLDVFDLDVKPPPTHDNFELEVLPDLDLELDFEVLT
jgi:hypothetical protein